MWTDGRVGEWRMRVEVVRVVRRDEMLGVVYVQPSESSVTVETAKNVGSSSECGGFVLEG